MRWKLSGGEWLFWFRLALKVTLVVGAVYLAYHFYERHRIANMTIGDQPTKRSLPSDAFVFVPKSYANRLELGTGEAHRQTALDPRGLPLGLSAWRAAIRAARAHRAAGL